MTATPTRAVATPGTAEGLRLLACGIVIGAAVTVALAQSGRAGRSATYASAAERQARRLRLWADQDWGHRQEFSRWRAMGGAPEITPGVLTSPHRDAVDLAEIALAERGILPPGDVWHAMEPRLWAVEEDVLRARAELSRAERSVFDRKASTVQSVRAGTIVAACLDKDGCIRIVVEGEDGAIDKARAHLTAALLRRSAVVGETAAAIQKQAAR